MGNGGSVRTYLLYAVLGGTLAGGGWLLKVTVLDPSEAEKKHAADEYFRFEPQKDKGNKSFRLGN